MRLKRLLLVITTLVFTAVMYAQSVDVLYLKNGSRIKGSVVEMNPDSGVKIETSDGSLFVYPMSDVDHVSKESATQSNSFSAIPAGRKIDRHRGNFYWEDSGKNLSSEEYSLILDDNLYTTFYSARQQYKSGRGLIFSGLIFIVAAAVAYDSYLSSGYYLNYVQYYDDSKLGTFYVMSAAADVCFATGFIFKGIGKGRMEWVKNTYNYGDNTNIPIDQRTKLGGRQTFYSSTLKLNPSLLMTAQRDLGLGASMVLTF